MSAGEEIYAQYASGIQLLHKMRSRSMDTEHWSHMLKSAFDTCSNTKKVDALYKVIEILQKNLDAHPGDPAAAVPNAHVPASAPPANSAPAEHPAPPAPLPLQLNAAPPSEQPPRKRARQERCGARVSHEFLEQFSDFTVKYY